VVQEGSAVPHEYDDPVYAGLVEAATVLTLQLRERRSSAPLHELAKEAVDVVFCTCVTTAADVAAGGRAPVHAGLVEEVRLRAERECAMGAPPDSVECASRDSFPASDPPAWIWR
jgi:hypothetical protein